MARAIARAKEVPLMHINIRRKLDMAVRVRDFCQSHPDPNEGYILAVARLDVCIRRADAMAEQQIQGRQVVAGAVRTITDLREELYAGLSLLAGLMPVASAEDPGLSGAILRPDIHGSHDRFVTFCRVAAETAQRQQELFSRLGMPPEFLEQFRTLLDRYDEMINQHHAGRGAHVGATAELSAVTDEIMRLVRQLDALNRFRFKHDPELLAAWKSARDVAWPRRGRNNVSGERTA
jgi:hypothetical protein